MLFTRIFTFKFSISLVFAFARGFFSLFLCQNVFLCLGKWTFVVVIVYCVSTIKSKWGCHEIRHGKIELEVRCSDDFWVTWFNPESQNKNHLTSNSSLKFTSSIFPRFYCVLYARVLIFCIWSTRYDMCVWILKNFKV